MAVSYTTERMLNFGDCDISGTAYYPSYLNILNGVIEEFWNWIGYPWHVIIWKERWGTPTVHLTCNFSKPSVTTRSPASSPRSMSIRSPSLGPTVTSRSSTVSSGLTT